MYFTKESSDQLKCNICSTVLTADNKNTASKEHIKDSHKDIYELHKDVLECSVGYQIEFLQFSMEGNKTQPVILEEICETQSEVIQEQLPKDIEDMQYILLRNVKSEDICRKRSWVWKYFDKLSKTIFRCNLCDVVLSIKGCNSNNMNRHIRSRHPVVYNSEVESKNKNENEKRPDPNSGKPLRSWVWTYFTRDSRTRATCKLCDKTISHGGNATGNLNRHLKIIHDKIDVSRKPRRSWIWSYFTRDSTTRATCTLCDKSISYGGNTTGNLNRHLKLKHKETSDENSKKRSWIWDYCEEVSEKISRCKICGSNVSVIGGNQSNINRHIIKTHSEVYESDILPKLIAEGKLRNPGPSYSRKYRRSWFWSFFTKVAPREALCHLCDSKVKLRADGKASFRLRKHLSSTHFNTNDRDCWLWVVFGEEGDEYKCKICSYKCTKTDDMENNLQTIRDHLKTDHGLESDAQIFAVHENENDKNETVRKKRSWIWDYFEELPNKLTQCKLCSMSLSIISGSQGNLNRHMRTNHPVVYKTEVHPMLRKGRPRKEEESSGNESEDEKNTEKENEDEIESENETEYEESAESD